MESSTVVVAQQAVTWSAFFTIISIVGAICTSVATIVVFLWNKFARQERELNQFKVEVAKTYVEASTLSKFEQRFEDALERLTTRFEDGFKSVLEMFTAQMKHGNKE